MTISLENIIPLPLKEKVISRPSEVWNQVLTLEPRQWIKVKAPSGTGKTTLVHVLWNLRNDYTGTVRYDGKAIREIGAEKMAGFRQQQLSVVFQDLRLFGQLTARENIELKRVLGKAPFYAPEVVDAMAEELGVAHVLQQQANTCSYGEQQRIAIIRSLMQPFDWLIMDEPFSHLDKANTQKAADLIARECASRGAGFLLTDLDEDDHFTYTRFLSL